MPPAGIIMACMEVQEHFYQDDPRSGHRDAKTTLPGVNYFFIGNGYIQAAVQVCTSGEGTPLGLLIMDPERLGPKRSGLSFDPAAGLEATMVRVRAASKEIAPCPGRVRVSWTELKSVPAVDILWGENEIEVRERFFCPDRRSGRLVRDIKVRNLGSKPAPINIKTGLKDGLISRALRLPAGGSREVFIEYKIIRKGAAADAGLGWVDKASISYEAASYWKRTASCRFQSDILDHFFRAAKYQLPAAVSAQGRMDGSIWQYNREWARDQALVATGFILSGHFEPARTILGRLFSRFVTDEGDVIDSSERRPYEECELDQNGVLLWALETYVNWTGDLDLARTHWPKVKVAARFPLKDIYVHKPSGLLHNKREFWERHSVHGVEDGMELAYQFWVSCGLASGARLARRLGKKRDAADWSEASQKIRKAILFDNKYGMVERGGFIKRRTVSGKVQEDLNAQPGSGLPAGVPLFEKGRHLLNPDTSTAFPIMLEFIDPKGDLAAKTLRGLEKLWNQGWSGGGYGRYHMSSEPDSPGPWPFSSLFVARAYFEAGRDARVWRVLRWMNTMPGAQAGSWFEFYGPRPVPPYPQVGIIPWTWSEILTLLVHHMLGVRPGWRTLLLKPRLLSGLNQAEASLRLRQNRLDIAVRREEGGEKPGMIWNGKFLPFQDGGWRIRISEKNARATIIQPR